MKALLIFLGLIISSATVQAADKKTSWDDITVNCDLYAGVSEREGASLRAKVKIPLRPSARGAQYGYTDGSAQVDFGSLIAEYRVTQSGGVVRIHSFLLQPQKDGSLASKGYGYKEGQLYGPEKLLNEPNLLSVSAKNVDMFAIDRDLSPENEGARLKKFKDAGIVITDILALCNLTN